LCYVFNPLLSLTFLFGFTLSECLYQKEKKKKNAFESIIDHVYRKKIPFHFIVALRKL
jgi:hypothetical protein